MRKKIPLEVGSHVRVIARGEEIVIKPVIEVAREQSWFWDKEWQEKEKKAIKDKRTENVKSFKKVVEAIEWLEATDGKAR